MKSYTVQVGDLVEHNVLAIDLPVVVCAMIREQGAYSANIIEEQA